MGYVPIPDQLPARDVADLVMLAFEMGKVNYVSSKNSKMASDKAEKYKKRDEELKQIWREGNFIEKQICADELYPQVLGYPSVDAARAVLESEKDPSPWPAKAQALAINKGPRRKRHQIV